MEETPYSSVPAAEKIEHEKKAASELFETHRRQPPPKPAPMPSPLIIKPEAMREEPAAGPPDISKTVDSILNQLQTVKMSFIIPVEVNIDDTIKAELILTPERIARTVEHTVVGKQTETKLLASSVVRAELKTIDFDVTEITPKEQALAETESTQWLWKLLPKHPGKGEVILTVTAIVKTPLGNADRLLKTYEQNLEVIITPKQKIIGFLEENWKWLWSTLLAPLAFFLWRKYKKQT